MPAADVGRLVPGLIEDVDRSRRSARRPMVTQAVSSTRGESHCRIPWSPPSRFASPCAARDRGAGCAAEFATFARSDMAFLLYAAERVLDGARLYVDVVEINPPLIVALNLPAVRARAGRSASSDIAMLPAAGDVSCCWAPWPLRRRVAARAGRWTRARTRARRRGAGDRSGCSSHRATTSGSGSTCWSRSRCPMCCWRWPGRGPGGADWGRRSFAGVLAGMGLALKPHFLLVWLRVEGYVAWRTARDGSSPRRSA